MVDMEKTMQYINQNSLMYVCPIYKNSQVIFLKFILKTRKNLVSPQAKESKDCVAAYHCQDSGIAFIIMICY